ncbi:Gfo/Idh/MocA family protein [Natronorubrum tibetense]|uniref:Oxidoreductase domain-containing protein n=1 Tax=Natronorubrum tibetense GA33 TaxID=1114856 RepID=L9W8L7_9EURY|nr:Gfo/Idh/MocA family oxidoreductase [Natronorubrum tibetense]ELY45814.1 oxidoreductase domain-containing protein [Natronorubrum tibetense GA33]
MRANEQLDVGVIGVGSMGQHHVRVYSSLPDANLVGVFDADENRARAVAHDHDTSAMEFDPLLDAVDAISIAVPTSAHYEIATRCLEAGVAALVEKPVVGDLETGQDLLERANSADVLLQVGHIERFNPAVITLAEILDEISVIGLASRRLGPPPNTKTDDSAVLDLMIHDIDIVLSLLDEVPTSVKGTGVRKNGHVSALVEFGPDLMASLTASHRTQRKVRTLEVTAEEGLFLVDYINQSIEIHRRSVPEYVEQNGKIRYRHESSVEHLHVPNEEPLRNELESFLKAVATNSSPKVTLEDGLNALEIAEQIEQQGLGTLPKKDTHKRLSNERICATERGRGETRNKQPSDRGG